MIEVDERWLSRVLFESRELADMLGDMVQARTGRVDNWTRRHVKEVDQFRREKGWSEGGFGGEGLDPGNGV
jgi:hypothetical protein